LTSGARAHHRSDLRDVLRRHLRFVVEDTTEVLAIGEDVGLQRQKGTAGVHEINAGQRILLGDLLRPEMFLDGDGKVRAALDGGVVCHNCALLPFDNADTCHDASAGRLAIIHIPRRQRIEFEEGRVRVAQALNAFAGKQLVARAMLGDGVRAAALLHLLDARP
jgi:hypothetical protein